MIVTKGENMSDFNEQEDRNFIIENCCSLCGEILDCDGPDNPNPGGVCEIDDGEFDDDEEEYL